MPDAVVDGILPLHGSNQVPADSHRSTARSCSGEPNGTHWLRFVRRFLRASMGR
jgi:hypothetical protein